MNKILFLLFINVFTLSLGQKVLDAKVITKQNDKLKVKLKVSANFIDPTILYVSSFNTRLTVFDENGKKSKIEIPYVKELSLIDFVGKERFFITKKDEEENEILVERLFNGNQLEWYRTYFSTGGGESGADYLYNKVKQKGTNIGYFTGIPKKKLIEFLDDEPSMKDFINDVNSSPLRNAKNNINVVMESILNKYESLKSNK